jgi:competence protein ComEA
VRERRSADDVVAARLRSVLAPSVGGAATSGRVPSAAGPLVGRGRGLESAPGVAAPVPPASTAAERSAAGYADFAEVGEPLRWSDILPGWPDDVDLDPVPSPVDSPAAAGPPGAESALRQETGSFPAGSAWAAPPGAGRQVPATEPAGVVRRPLPAPAWVLPEPVASAPDGAAHPARIPVPSARPTVAGREAVAEARPGPDARYQAVDDRGDHVRRDDRPSGDAYEEDSEPVLSGAGAFGGRAGPGPSGRGIGLGAFDPGRRGVRALAVVAILVVLIAAVLAWRARPRVDAVAPPSFDVAGASVTTRPEASATVARAAAGTPAEVVVAVAGKVHKPGLVRLPADARVADALTAAGGADAGVDVALLNLARKVVDGELILVGVTPPPGVAVATGPARPATGGPAGGPVNLNTATLADLDTLPGVGPVLAQRILEARDAQGGFTAVGDLRKVDGIGDARYDQLKDLVTV